jgi:hypothetical protein
VVVLIVNVTDVVPEPAAIDAVDKVANVPSGRPETERLIVAGKVDAPTGVTVKL